MKLLNCTTLRIEEFFGPSVPPYAILSHRWEAGEVTYQEVMNLQGLDQKAGWVKVREACRVARSKGYDYAWVDTCCINKQDLTELTEAINSMFQWYAKAGVCFAYLSDVPPGQSSIESSLWFTRGFTLQELIAPNEVEFLDSEWHPIGTRATRCNEIHLRTRIDKEVLLRGATSGRTVERILDDIPLARRMSWASGRTTTREEDVAYSLLGVFGINMPLLYGEGKNAFMRLQTEIMKEKNDMTLFAWVSSPAKPDQQGTPRYRGILATSPREFEHASDLVFSKDITYNPEVSFAKSKHNTERLTEQQLTLDQYAMTNKGLRIDTELNTGKDKTQYLRLGCRRNGWDPEESASISLIHHGGGVFLRSQPSKIFTINNVSREGKMTLYVKKHTEEEPPVVAGYEQSFCEAYQFHYDPQDMERMRVVPASMWNEQKRMFVTKNVDSFNGFAQFRMVRERSTHDFIVACGFTSRDRGWICMASSTDKNRNIYSAAISGDLRKVRELAIRANENGKTVSERIGIVSMTIPRREGELVCHIHLNRPGCYLNRPRYYDNRRCLVM